ncbi:MAG: hypothetical protein ABTR20_13390 [Candidatus Competibacter sp.]
MYAHPQFIKRNPIKTQVDDQDYKMLSAMAEFNGLSIAELTRIFIQEGIERRVRKQGQYGQSSPA